MASGGIASAVPPATASAGSIKASTERAMPPPTRQARYRPNASAASVAAISQVMVRRSPAVISSRGMPMATAQPDLAERE